MFKWLEEYNDDDGSGGVNIVIKRDDQGEQKIVKVTGSVLTTDLVREI